MQRFSTTPELLEPQPRPGQRETRYRIPRDRSMHRPMKEDAHE